MTLAELATAIRKILPEAEFSNDLDGQVVIYSGLQLKANGNLEEFSPPETD